MLFAYRVSLLSTLAMVGLGIGLGSCGGGGSGGTGNTASVSSPVALASSSSSSSASGASASSSSATSVSPAAKAGYDLTFDENFDTLDVSARGPGTRWIAHTPWNGDFGDAQFADPMPGFPFTTDNGILRIEARKTASGQWQSGLLASVDSSGNGFSQQYGYFEMRAKLPPGAGLWPAFWLDSLVPADSNDPSLEVDALEYYGQFTGNFMSTIHLWPKGNPAAATTVDHLNTVPANSLTSDYHVYGVSVEADWIIVYLDGTELWRTPTPAEHKHKLMILVNLALGGGWPITDAPSPSYMYVDYIRAYKRSGT
jgi:beta-glucanase (GH16 family)